MYVRPGRLAQGVFLSALDNRYACTAAEKIQIRS